VPTRHRQRARHLLPLPTCDVVQADVHDDVTLDRLVGCCDTIVNLIGVLYSRAGTPYGRDFARAHVELPRRIAAACARHGGRRVVHVSALGLHDGTGPEPVSAYLRSKRDGERVLRAEPSLTLTVFRPSVVFGPEDAFLNLFARLQRILPVMPLARADARLQPVYVGDVAQAIVQALDEPRTLARCYELTGPDVFTLGQLARLAGELSGHPRPVLPLPDALGWLQAALLEFAPGPTLMSRDNFHSLSQPSVATPGASGWAPELGVRPTPLMAVAPQWLGASDPMGALRAHAHR
jgi:uncharacterized protein YbjT (DUF2867 family)